MANGKPKPPIPPELARLWVQDRGQVQDAEHRMPGGSDAAAWVAAGDAEKAARQFADGQCSARTMIEGTREVDDRIMALEAKVATYQAALLKALTIANMALQAVATAVRPSRDDVARMMGEVEDVRSSVQANPPGRGQ